MNAKKRIGVYLKRNKIKEGFLERQIKKGMEEGKEIWGIRQGKIRGCLGRFIEGER